VYDGGYIIAEIPNINYKILLSGGITDDITFYKFTNIKSNMLFKKLLFVNLYFYICYMLRFIFYHR